MAKRPPPVPMPRTRFGVCPVEVNPKPQKWNSTSSPSSPSEPPIYEVEKKAPGAVKKTPPPVAEKKFKIQRYYSADSCDAQQCNHGISEDLKLLNIGEEDYNHIYQAVLGQPSLEMMDAKNTAVTQKNLGGCEEAAMMSRMEDPAFLAQWWKTVISWKDLEHKQLQMDAGEAKLYSVKAERVYYAQQLYVQLLNAFGEDLRNSITELFSIADHLNKVSKGSKIAGITGGATSAVGGVAAVAGILLSPVTLGASLALTVVGVGVATAGGVTGASAAIAHKVNTKQDRKRIENVLLDYVNKVKEIEACLLFINRGMESLRKHNLATLTGFHSKAVRVSKVAEVAGESARAMDASSKASGMLFGFTLGIDIYFSNKDGQKLKKGLESKFAEKIRTVAKQLENGLEELLKVKEIYKELVEKV